MPTSHSKSVLPKSISPNSDDPGISQDSMEFFGFEFRLYKNRENPEGLEIKKTSTIVRIDKENQ